jgi:hypothetical protein
MAKIAKQTKICTTCKKEYPATDEYWHKMKNGKYGYRSKCKECLKIYSKQYTSTDEYKKYHNEKMQKWREENPGKALEISRKCYKKNADRFNAKKREKLKTDPEYREKVRERERKYVESGRRHEMNCKPEMREKARLRSKKRRQNPVKKEHDYKCNAKWREKNKEHLNELHKKNRKELCSSYVAQSMRISVKDLTSEILETQRLIIKLKRELKNNNVKIR